MGIVNGDAPDAGEAREFPGLLVAVLFRGRGVALGEFFIAPFFSREELDVMRAVHGLQGELMPLARRDAEELILELVPVPAPLVEFFFRDVRDVHAFVPCGFAEFPDIAVEDVAEHRALRGPERQSRADEVGEGKEVELYPEFLVVALFRLIEHPEVLVELLFCREGSAVDAGELRVLFVAFPIGAGDGGDSECIRVNIGGVLHVAAAAEIGKRMLNAEC